MAVERKKEFVLNLGELVTTRFESFVNVRKNILAKEEAEFQRRIIDDDLDFESQLAYRKKQLERELERKTSDVKFITELKTSISDTKKIIRQKKIRDKHFSFLEELSSGKKGLDDYVVFLENEINSGNWSRETLEGKDGLKQKLMEVKKSIMDSKTRIFNAQITFWQKDRTLESFNKAISALDSKMNEIEVQKNPELLESYRLTKQALEKQKTEITIENNITNLSVQLLTKEVDNPSIYKLNNFNDLFTNASDLPVNVGGIHYNSEKEYWQQTLYDFVQNKFAAEFSAETKDQVNRTYNKLGILPNDYLSSFKTVTQTIKNNTVLAQFPNVVLDAIQGSVASILDTKAKEITTKYALDKGFIGESEYNSAMNDLKSLQTYFGEDYSVTPAITGLENSLALHKYNLVGDIQSSAQALVDSGQYATIEEAIKAIGPLAEVETPLETYKTGSATDIAAQEIEQGKKIPSMLQQKTDVEQKIKDTQAKIDEAKRKKEMEQRAADLKKQIEETKRQIEAAKKQKKATTQPVETQPVIKKQKTELPFPKSTATQTAQQVMTEYRKKQAAGQYTFEGGKWYSINK